jgi:hypothetical protein
MDRQAARGRGPAGNEQGPPRSEEVAFYGGRRNRARGSPGGPCESHDCRSSKSGKSVMLLESAEAFTEDGAQSTRSFPHVRRSRHPTTQLSGRGALFQGSS